MKIKYSLVHLTNIMASPPDFIRVAARAGYDCVSLRTIPMGLQGEVPHDLTNPELLRETKRALEETGIIFNDTENTRIADGVDVKNYEPHLAVFLHPCGHHTGQHKVADHDQLPVSSDLHY